MTLACVYERLAGAYGPRNWWPGDSAFEVMAGAILTQNTAWRNVERALAGLRDAGALSLRGVLSLTPERLAQLLRPAGCFNVKARRLRTFCEWLQAAGGVEVLRRRDTAELRGALLGIHGIGPETADDILLYALGRPVFVIDAYTRRIGARLGLLNGGESYDALRARFEAELPADAALYGEYHALIVEHAKRACRVRPRCEDCCLNPVCESAR